MTWSGDRGEPVGPDGGLDGLFGGDGGMPPDAWPVRKRGRPKGSRNKPKAGAVAARGEAAKVEPRPADPPARPPGEGAASDPTSEAAVARLKELLAPFDFRAFGTKARILVLVVQDTSPSEVEHEAAWVEGSRSIPAEINRSVTARNLIDVVHCCGDEGFRVEGVSYGKDFRFPAGQIRYGTGTAAGPWLRGCRAVVEAYRAELAGRGVGVREVVVVLATDFQFADDFRAELAAFREWARRERAVTVVPAGFGNWQPAVAAEFADGVAPADLNAVSLGRFFRAVSESVVRVSQSSPREGLLAQGLSNALRNLKPDAPNG